MLFQTLPPDWQAACDRTWRQAGGAAVLLSLSADSEKRAGEATTVHALQGRLYLSKSGWLLLSVPNALGRGAFDALGEAGAEIPDGADYTAHCSIMRPEEVAKLGGPNKITERGHMFPYTLGPVRTVQPKTWKGTSRVWYLTVISPALQALRKSYGLSPQPNGDWDFHITFATRKTNVLRNNEVSKAAAALGIDFPQPPAGVTIQRPVLRTTGQRFATQSKTVPAAKAIQALISGRPAGRAVAS